MARVSGQYYLAARNFAGRPTLMHRVTFGNRSMTVCGTDVSNWSRVWFAEPIEILLCLRCKKFMAKSGTVLEFPKNRLA